MPHLYFFRHDRARKGVHKKNKGQFGEKYWYKWWKKACRNLEIEGVDLYGGTRHSTVIDLGEHYTPEEIMLNGTGHTTNKAFSRYFQLKVDKKREIYRRARGKGDTKVIQLNASNGKGNFLKLHIKGGGGGGSRTPVRKHST
ncbi:MAG: hypothetical protein JRC68_06960 [Deltaproteobacteria bacterium]|nr:hypothetical protein [Deltaproteobacteria bacterium]